MSDTAQLTALLSPNNGGLNRSQLAAPSSPDIERWLTVALRMADDARQRTGCTVKIGLTLANFRELALRVDVRKRYEGGDIGEISAVVDFLSFAASEGRILFHMIDRAIERMEREAQELRNNPLKIHENNREKVDKASQIFYETLDVQIDSPYKERNWREFSQTRPIEAAAIRKAMLAAMKGGPPTSFTTSEGLK